jgi:hypothetical protein
MMRWAGLLLLGFAGQLAAQDAPVPFDLARGTPLTIGQWRYAATALGSDARFGNHFAIVCNRPARRVTLQRIDRTAGPMTITIVTDLGMRTLPVNGVVGISDPVLDAIAFSRGRFLVDRGGAARLVIPASPEAARSIEDCRI